MRVGFLSNQLDNRGTGNAMFDYAKYNRDLLGNESYIYSYVNGEHNGGKVYSFQKEFGPINYVYPHEVQQIDGIDVLYHIKYGNDDGIRTNPSVRYAVHSVFANEPHGDRYATVSRWLSGSSGVPFVPHIVDLPSVSSNLRTVYGIPETAIVFGRYGGYDTFDISWVWDVIFKILEQNNNTWFLFANTAPYSVTHRRIVYTDELTLPGDKAIFINTCDYMLHARHRGETFGISVGEFGIKGRPVITYGLSGEKAHIDYLAGLAMEYNDQFDLYALLTTLSRSRTRGAIYTYTLFTPKNVMQLFEKVFLS